MVAFLISEISRQRMADASIWLACSHLNHVVHACSRWRGVVFRQDILEWFLVCGCFCWTNLCALRSIWGMNLGLLVVSWDDSPQGYAVDRITGTNLGHGRGNTPQAAKENSEHFSTEESIFGATSTNHPGRAYPCQIPRFQPRAALPAEESRCFSLVPAAMCHGILRLTSNPSLAGALRRRLGHRLRRGSSRLPGSTSGQRLEAHGIARRTGTAPSGVRPGALRA